MLSFKFILLTFTFISPLLFKQTRGLFIYCYLALNSHSLFVVNDNFSILVNIQLFFLSSLLELFALILRIQPSDHWRRHPQIQFYMKRLVSKHKVIFYCRFHIGYNIKFPLFYISKVVDCYLNQIFNYNPLAPPGHLLHCLNFCSIPFKLPFLVITSR